MGKTTQIMTFTGRPPRQGETGNLKIIMTEKRTSGLSNLYSKITRSKPKVKKTIRIRNIKLNGDENYKITLKQRI